MGVTGREKVSRIPQIRRGDPISARFLNRLVAGANAANAGVSPPKSLKTRSTDEQINELQEGSNQNERIFTEVSKTTTTVRFFQNNDPESENWVDVPRIDKISFQAGDEVLTLILDWA